MSARDVVPLELLARREARDRCDVREAFGNSVALVLGVNDYRSGIPRLKTAVPDAEAVGAALEREHGYTTLLGRDAEVTGARVRAVFEHELAARVGGPLGERDRLVVYFAGHGLSLPSAHGPEGYLLLADAEPGDPGSFFAMAELRRLIGALRCRHVLVVLDCCFAGTFRWASRRRREVCEPAYRETFERFVAHRAWQVLVSASHDQAALDAVPPARAGAGAALAALGASRIETAQHSPFAAAFLRGLRGEADFTRDGLIIAAELELFVRDAVERATQIQQSPQLYKLDEHDRGEFVFQVPGAALALPAAPALSPGACPFPGLAPFTAADRAAFFGRGHAAAALVDRIAAQPVTVVLGPPGVGKSSLLGAGLAPALRDTGWTVLEVRLDAAPDERPDERPDETPDETLDAASRDPLGAAGGELDPRALPARVAAWASAHPAGPLCLVLDQAERLDALACEVRDRVHGELADVLAAHAGRLRVVAAVRSELDPASRAAALEPFGAARGFAVPPLAQHELREVIEQPARALELAFDPPGLVDTLINDALGASGGLALLSLALRELYLRCAERNRDRMLTEADYVRMGGLGGPVCERATELLRALVARDARYRGTARRVFLRMAVHRDGRWLCRRVHRDELDYHDAAENRRVARLLAAYRDARLVVCDRHVWRLAHDELVRDWPSFVVWRERFSDALGLQSALAEAAARWSGERRAGALWTRGEHLSAAIRADRASGSWLNRRERAFVAACARRRRRRTDAAVALIVLAIAGAIIAWALHLHVCVEHDGDGVPHRGELAGAIRASPRAAATPAAGASAPSRTRPTGRNSAGTSPARPRAAAARAPGSG